MNTHLKVVLFSLLIAGGIAAGVSYFLSAPEPMPVEIVETVPEETHEEEQELLPIELAPHTVTLQDGSEVTYNIAAPFEITVAAEDLGKARFMAMSPDGRLFVPDLVDYNLSHEGRLFVLEDFDSQTHEFKTKHTYLSGLRGPNSVAFYTDKDGQDWLYLALTAHLVRYPYNAGDTEPSGEPEIITEFPNTQTPGETSVVWHITRTIKIHNDRIYVAIGSGCNSCEQLPGALRGMVTSMNPDGSDVQVYASGLRNSVGIEWANDTLYTTVNGVDHLGPDRPDELLHKLEEGVHYGWPYCYESDGEQLPDTTTTWPDPPACEDVPKAFAAFEPHSAPLGLAYFANAHPLLQNTFLVALHGSFEPGVKTGYEIVRVNEAGEQEIFMDGFQSEDGERYGRPVDILQVDETSFFFTDDHAGRIYYVFIPNQE